MACRVWRDASEVVVAPSLLGVTMSCLPGHRVVSDEGWRPGTPVTSSRPPYPWLPAGCKDGLDMVRAQREKSGFVQQVRPTDILRPYRMCSR